MFPLLETRPRHIIIAELNKNPIWRGSTSKRSGFRLLTANCHQRYLSSRKGKELRNVFVVGNPTSPN